MSTMSAESKVAEPIVRYDIRKAVDCWRRSGRGTQSSFAFALGITPSYLSDLISGKFSPSPKLFTRICLLTALPPSEYVYLDTPAR